MGARISTQVNGEQPLTFTSMAVLQERRASGRIHYHVALLADKCFGALPTGRARLGPHLLAAHGLASHWSGKADGYADCVAYPQKPWRGWILRAVVGYLRRRGGVVQRKAKRSSVCEKWVCGPSVIRENIAPDEVCAEKWMAYAKRSGGRALADLCVANWDKLPVIVAKSWKTEKVAAQ